MRRILPVSVVAALSIVILVASTAFAGNAHFVGTPTLSSSGASSGKVAGLGNIPQIHVEITADALCINSGGNHPKAANKATTGADTDVPVQNGRAQFSVQLPTPVFKPDCSPPMTVRFENLKITVSDPSGNVLLTFP